MDIISLQKATKAKREIKKVKDRLGDGVQATYANVKGRVEALESKKIGEDTATYMINTDQQWNAGTMNNASAADGVLTGEGSWIGEIELQDAVSLSKIGIQTKIIQQGDYTSLIPSMTSATEPTPLAASASSGSGYGMFSDAYRATWQSSFGVTTNQWVAIDLGSAKNVTQYTMSTGMEAATTNMYAGGMPGSWRLEASNDNVSWTTIDTRTATSSDWGGYRYWQTPIVKTFQFTNANAYRYYRFYFVQTADRSSSTNNFIVGRTQLFEPGAAKPIYTENDFSSADVTIDTGKGFEALGSGGVINSKFNTKIKVKIAAPAGKSLGISKLSISYRSRPINIRVSEMEKMVAINLNKHNLRVDTLLNARKYRLTDMVVDSFDDDSGIDPTLSSNYAYNAAEKKVGIASGSDKATIVTKPETSNTIPNVIFLSHSSGIRSQDEKDFNLSSGQNTNTVFTGQRIELTKQASGQYNPEGVWESAAIDLGENYKSFVKSIIDFKPQRVYKESKIPIMTSNTAPYGKALGENYTSTYSIFKAFDGALNTRAIITNSSDTSRFIGYAFVEPIVIECYSITSIDSKVNSVYNPVSWIFEASNDGTTWVKLDEQSGQQGWSFSEKRVYEIDNNTAYLQYRISILSTDSPTGTGYNYVGIGEMDMLEADYKSQVEFQIATSTDGSRFSSYSPVDKEGNATAPTGRYVKIKAFLKASVKTRERAINNFDASEASRLTIDDQVILDGQLRMKTKYLEVIAKDDQYTEQGTMFRFPIKKADFKNIEKVVVKHHG